jgi:hypothetical protein
MRLRCGSGAAAVLFALLIAFYSWQLWVATVHQKHYPTHQNADHSATGEIQPSAPEERIAYWTAWLTGFTGLLAFVSAIQIGFLIRADKTARIMAETAQAQTHKMGDWADSAAKQILIAGRQTDIQEKQHAIGRLQFFAMHRPKIILREAIIGTVLEGEPIHVIMNIVNIGSTTGIIVHSTVNVRIVPPGKQFILSGSTVDIYDDLGPITLVAGQSVLIPYPKPDAPKYQAHKFTLRSYPIATGNFIERRDSDIILTGQLLYEDEIGTQRRTAFFRILDLERRRFYLVPNEPDLDYSD